MSSETVRRQRRAFAALTPENQQSGFMPEGGRRLAILLCDLPEAGVLWSSTMPGVGMRPEIVRLDPNDYDWAKTASRLRRKAVQVLIYCPWGGGTLLEAIRFASKDGCSLRIYAVLGQHIFEWWGAVDLPPDRLAQWSEAEPMAGERFSRPPEVSARIGSRLHHFHGVLSIDDSRWSLEAWEKEDREERSLR